MRGTAFWGELVRNTVSKVTDVSFSEHLTWQTDSKYHTERGKVPKSFKDSHQRSVVSRVSLAEEKTPQNGFSVQVQSWKGNLGRMLEQVTQQLGLLVSAEK